MKKLTIGEIEEMTVQGLEKRMTSEEAERMHKLGFAEYETFLGMMKDDATLSGLQENDLYVSIDEYLSHLEEKYKDYEDTESVKHELNAEYGKEATQSLTVKEENQLSGFSNDGFNGNISRPDILTNIKDKKMIFNLGKHVDKKLNDCVGQEITIDKILIKKYVKPLDTPIYDAQTGEILADTKTSMSVVIVDKDGTSYATGSKTFGYALINAIYDFGNEIDGLKIRIIKTLRSGAQNQSLDFELV